jgi:hypothetical protein
VWKELEIKKKLYQEIGELRNSKKVIINEILDMLKEDRQVAYGGFKRHEKVMPKLKDIHYNTYGVLNIRIKLIEIKYKDILEKKEDENK